jgi:hypothetical protein
MPNQKYRSKTKYYYSSTVTPQVFQKFLGGEGEWVVGVGGGGQTSLRSVFHS